MLRAVYRKPRLKKRLLEILIQSPLSSKTSFFRTSSGILAVIFFILSPPGIAAFPAEVALHADDSCALKEKAEA